ncbi:hypothetical protein KAU08_12985 [bacterium]|nr:hypothetical protein [bacterium]
MDKARESEVKANLHTIHEALERYGVDHSGEYPAYIFGGDSEGWDDENGCRVITDVDPDDRPPLDPLLDAGYLASYPSNPFLSSNSALRKVVALTGSEASPGAGDVRFGLNGDIMGNCLDDPRYLFDIDGNTTNYANTMLSDPDSGIGVVCEDRSNSFYCMGGLDGRKNWWPGEFFYRSGGDFFLEDPDNLDDEKYRLIWGWPYFKINKYMLGAYGSLKGEGLDIIRLTSKQGLEAATMNSTEFGIVADEYYQDPTNPYLDISHPDFNVRVLYSNPETMGGGEQGYMPTFPYYQTSSTAWIYGALDGFNDGIILLLTSGGEHTLEYEIEISK